MLDPYVYPGTNILKNILGIQDRQMLDDAEADYVSLRLRELAENPLEGNYDVGHLAEMHKYIFQDIYEWAGKIRTINIEKEEPALGGLSIEYSDKAEIEGDLSDALKKMASRSWANLSLDDRAKCFSEDLAVVWKVHGFRDDGVIIGTRLEKPSKINGFALLSPNFFMPERENGITSLLHILLASSMKV